MKNICTQHRGDIIKGFFFSVLCLFLFPLTFIAQSPGGVAGAKLWVRADAAGSIVTGTGVQTWKDQSGNANDLTQAISTQQPTLLAGAINFNPALRFTKSAAQSLVHSGSVFTAGTGEMNIFLLGKPIQTGIANGILSFKSANAAFFGAYVPFSDAFVTWDMSNGTFVSSRVAVAPSPAYTAGVPNLNAFINTQAGATQQAIWKDGKLITSNTSGATPAPFSDQVQLGQYVTNFYDGQVPEFIIFNRDLSTAEKLQVSSYQALKYGISLDQTTAQDYLASNGSKFWNSSAGATYKNRIFGIGRDDLSTLEQRISTSTTATGTDALMTLSTDNNFTGANPGTHAAIPTDKSFFVIADDNGTSTGLTGWTTANAPANRQILNRNWQVQRSGISSTTGLFLQVDVSKISGAGTGASYYLLYNVNADNIYNTASTTEYPGTQISGSLYSFAIPPGASTGIVGTISTATFTIASTIPPTPGGVTGETLWLRADAGVSTMTPSLSTPVWVDQSASNNNGFLVTTIAPALNIGSTANAINYNPVVSFSNSALQLANNSTTMGINGTNNFSVVSVYRTAASLAPFGRLFGGLVNGTNNPAVANTANTSWEVVVGPSTALSVLNTGAQSLQTGTNNIPTLFGGIRASANNYFVPLNGSKPTGNAGASGFTSGFSENPLSSPYTIGISNLEITAGTKPNASTNGSNPFVGDLAEFIIFPTDLSATGAATTLANGTNLSRVNSYLALKYGITLNQTTPQDYLASDGSKFWNSAMAGAYKNRIFGIGRDTTTALEQRISQSTTATSNDALLTLSTDNNFTGANPGTHAAIPADKSFLMIADDNGALGWTITNAPTNRQIIIRNWQMQATGITSTGGLYLQIDMGKLPSPQGMTYYLEYNPTGTNIYNTGTTNEIPGVQVSGSLYSFALPTTVSNGSASTPAVFTIASTLTPIPGGVSGATLWLKADAGTGTTTDGTVVTSWVNGGSVVASITNSGSPVYHSGASASNINFNPVVSTSNGNFFNSNNDFGVINANTFSALSVAKVTAFGSYQSVFGGTLNNTGQISYGFVGNKQSVDVNNILATRVGAQTYTINTPMLTGLTRGPSATNYQLLDNGNADGPLQVHSASLLATNLQIGSARAGSLTLNGSIAELIIFNTPLAIGSTDWVKANSYLALKYGTTLDQTTAQDYLASDGSKFWDGSTGASYQNRIFGIGRDDVSSLEQRVSTSTIATGNDALLTLATSNDFTSANNTGTRTPIPADKNFFMISDDNATMSWTTTGAPANRQIVGRNWQTQASGSSTGLFIQVDVSKLPIGRGNSYYLLYNNAGTNIYTGTIAEIPGTQITGNLYGFALPAIPGSAGSISTATFTIASSLPTSPGGVAGADLWLRADAQAFSNAGTTAAVNGGAVQQWNDQSASTNNAAEATLANRPSFNDGASSNAINFNPSLTFGATGTTVLSTASPVFPVSVAMNNVNVFSTFRNFTTTELDWFLYQQLLDNNGSKRFAMYWNYLGATTGASDVGDYHVSSGLSFPFNTNVPNNTAVMFGSYSSATGNIDATSFNQVDRINEKQVAGNSGYIPFTPASTQPLQIGNNTIATGDQPGGANVWDGNLGEVIIFRKSMTASERSQVNSYMALKYGITLDQTAPQDYLASNGSTKMWTAAAAGMYNNNIFGLGRDDNSGLLQKVSASQNARGIATVALQNNFVLANNDASRTSTFAADNNFFTVADNAAATGNPVWTSTSAPANTNLLSSQWQVQTNVTGGQQVYFQFDAGNSNYDVPAPLTGTAYYLVYDNSGTISSSSTVVLLTNNSGNLWSTASAISFANGAAFTLATAVLPLTAGATASSQTVCAGKIPSNPLTQTIAVAGGCGTYVYQWELSANNGTTWTNIAGATAVGYTIPNAISAQTLYRRRVTDACATTIAAVPDTIYITGTAVVFSAQPADAAICEGTAQQFQVVASGTGLSYQWKLNNGSGIFNAITDGTVYSGTTTASLSLTGVTAGMNAYQYICVVSNSTGCSYNSATATLTVYAKPALTTSADTTICPATNATIKAISSGSTLLWTGLGTNSSYVVSPATSTDYLVTATGAHGCQTTAKVTITIEALNATLTAQPTPAKAAENLTLTAGGTSNFSVLAWTPTGSFSNQITRTQTLLILDTSYYSVVLKSPIGCLDTAKLKIIPDPNDKDFFVPNAFTPDGDGKNDVFKAYGRSITTIELRVFNQWGQLLFETKDANAGWNGYYKGALQPSGPYIYTVRVKLFSGKEYTKQSSFNLVR